MIRRSEAEQDYADALSVACGDCHATTGEECRHRKLPGLDLDVRGRAVPVCAARVETVKAVRHGGLTFPRLGHALQLRQRGTYGSQQRDEGRRAHDRAVALDVDIRIFEAEARAARGLTRLGL